MMTKTQTTEKLTDAMEKALDIAKLNGAVFAGYNVVNGCRYTVVVSTIIALERRGMLVTSIHTDGGVMGRRTSF